MSSLNKLKEQFDRVLIKYTDKKCEVILVDGFKVFIGRSRRHENDSFNRKLGRTIALGRAEFAYKVHTGEKVPRSVRIHHLTGQTCTLSEMVIFTDATSVDEFIVSFLPKKESQEAS